MLKVVLVEPEIPQNAGNIARTCACVGAELHMIEPLGFRMTNKYFSRSGCDYWDKLNLVRWPSLDKFFEEHDKNDMWFFTGRVKQSFRDVNYTQDSWLVFGRETAGLPVELIENNEEHCVRIPMKKNLRSLNLSNSVAVGLYEALRQNKDIDLI